MDRPNTSVLACLRGKKGKSTARMASTLGWHARRHVARRGTRRAAARTHVPNMAANRHTVSDRRIAAAADSGALSARGPLVRTATKSEVRIRGAAAAGFQKLSSVTAATTHASTSCRSTGSPPARDPARAPLT